MVRIFIVLSFLIAATQASAVAVFRFSEVGDDVVGTLSGTLDVAGLTSTDTTFTGCASCTFYSAGAVIVGSNDTAQRFDQYLVSGPKFFFTPPPSLSGNTVSTAGSSYSGDPFGLFAGQNKIYLPTGYDGSSELNGVLRLTGQDFDTLGVEPGSYEYELAFNGEVMDRFNVVFDNTVFPSVPLPSGVLLLISAIGAVSLGRVRARRSA